MQPVLDAEQMRAADRMTIEGGVPGQLLMANAGTAVARAVQERFPYAQKVTVLCGRGNNGGDGYVVARRLHERAPVVYLLGRRAGVSGAALVHLHELERGGVRVTEVVDESAWRQVRDRAFDAELVVDALLGTGLREAPSGLVGLAIRDLAAAQARTHLAVVAVDIPSGLSSDSGEVEWETVRATLTVTLAAPKYGHVLPPACERVGDLLVADIGIPREAMVACAPRLWLLEASDAALAWPPREPAAHKGTFGHVLVVAGSVGKTGAAILAGLGALRAGAGLVTVATAAAALPVVAEGRPELMTEPLPDTTEGAIDAAALERALELAAARDAVVLGPGLGQAEPTREFVRRFVARCPAPLIIDADGLNNLAPAGPESAASSPRAPARVLTPHPGEMARLLGSATREVQTARLQAARQLARESGATVVLKGQRTLVAEAAGRAAVNPTGNPGMATGGTGDVLSGIVGALLARGHDGWTAAVAAVYVHGLAGDRAAARLGQESLLAGDVVDALPEALRSLGGAPSGAP